MPAKSKRQQRFMGMAYAYKTGELKKKDIPEGIRDAVVNAAKNIPEKKLKDFATTKHKGLPENVTERKRALITSILKEEGNPVEGFGYAGWSLKHMARSLGHKIAGEGSLLFIKGLKIEKPDFIKMIKHLKEHHGFKIDKIVKEKKAVVLTRTYQESFIKIILAHVNSRKVFVKVYHSS